MRKSWSDRDERPGKKTTMRKSGTSCKARADSDTSSLRPGDEVPEMAIKASSMIMVVIAFSTKI